MKIGKMSKALNDFLLPSPFWNNVSWWEQKWGRGNYNNSDVMLVVENLIGALELQFGKVGRMSREGSHQLGSLYSIRNIIRQHWLARLASSCCLIPAKYKHASRAFITQWTYCQCIPSFLFSYYYCYFNFTILITFCVTEVFKDFYSEFVIHWKK